MTFNPLKEKGIPLEKQLRTWEDIAKRPFNKFDVDCYSRTRQILMNGIEVEAWGFKHAFARFCDNNELIKKIGEIRRIEDMQETTVNWLSPAEQTVLETTLGYEQVAVDLTAWLAQNEPDDYVRETFDFGLLEDFDHLYRYSQWIHMLEDCDPDRILQGQTDVFLGRPTQYHHNDNKIRIRKPYNKHTASPQTKVNILTLVSGEQQTHNFYAEHGFMYANANLRQTYAEICDVEEEHVSMYESLIDPTETMFEKLLIHEFTEVCNYYTCMTDETDTRLKMIWEEFLAFELEHLRIANELLQKHENRDAEEIIGNKIIYPCRFKSQKEYVAKVLDAEIDKRLDGKDTMGYCKTDELSSDWPSYKVQKIVNGNGAPSEMTIQIVSLIDGRDTITADEPLKSKQVDLLARGLQIESMSPDTVTPDELEILINNKDE